MPDVLRVYDPAECDEHGVPLDWERCRRCLPHKPGYIAQEPNHPDGAPTMDVFLVQPCPTCDGHGSLKAAALDGRTWRRQGVAPGSHLRAEDPVRCEDCGHPMNDGTWEGRVVHDSLARYALGEGREPDHGGVHYSPCDEGCRHSDDVHCTDLGDPYPFDLQRARRRADSTIEVTWRPVDVRTLGWPHDLRPERLATLCLRCYAARTAC